MTGSCGGRPLPVYGRVGGTSPRPDPSNNQRRDETIIKTVGKRRSGERVSSDPLMGQTSKRCGDVQFLDRTIGQGFHRPSVVPPEPRHGVPGQRIEKHPLGPDTVALMLSIVAATPRRLPHLHPIRRAIAAARIARRVY
jgi:hypothetical protein